MKETARRGNVSEAESKSIPGRNYKWQVAVGEECALDSQRREKEEIVRLYVKASQAGSG